MTSSTEAFKCQMHGHMQCCNAQQFLFGTKFILQLLSFHGHLCWQALKELPNIQEGESFIEVEIQNKISGN